MTMVQRMPLMVGEGSEAAVPRGKGLLIVPGETTGIDLCMRARVGR